MQITPQRQSYQAKTNFQGFRSKDARALLAVDLDGTLAHGTNADIQSVFQKAEEINATVCYVTGRTLPDFRRLQENCQKKGIDLKTPPHLNSSNGQFIFDNVGGELVEDLNWRDVLHKRTNFYKPTIYQTLYNIGHMPKYMHSEEDVQKLKQFKDEKLGGFAERVQDDADFWNSKMTYYEWSPSEHMVEYFVGHDVHVPQLKREIKRALSAQGIKTKFIYHEYDKATMDPCSTSILRKSRPLREAPDGTMRGLFLCPAHKADSVEYLGKRLHIPNDEILTAGNDSNDISLADFSKKGSMFVCVGNSLAILTDHAKRLKSDTIIFAEEHGAKGIVEGMERAIAQFRRD